MSDNNSQVVTRFNPLLIALHWLTVLFMVGLYAAINLSEVFSEGSSQQALVLAIHYSLGLSVLFAVMIRVVVRLSTTVPPIVPEPAPKEKLISLAMHLALYLFMIALPLLGWLILSAEGEAIRFFGIELPALMQPGDDYMEILHELHEVGGNIGYFLIAVHAAAGLFHHYKKHDNTLLRMSFLKKS